ncbi:MAG: hypothetical protein JSW47_02775 [Phycisphaerales bacterium]|nr:MAG: hypothetical protein JSW47_02775 [Phycisphaerales bacterium]
MGGLVWFVEQHIVNQQRSSQFHHEQDLVGLPILGTVFARNSKIDGSLSPFVKDRLAHWDLKFTICDTVGQSNLKLPTTCEPVFELQACPFTELSQAAHVHAYPV